MTVLAFPKSSFEQEMNAEMERAMKFGAFLDRLSEPTPKQAWLLRAGEQLREQERGGAA